MHKKECKFITAAKVNKYDDLRKIIEKIDKAKLKRKAKENFDIDAKDSTGSTALHYASRHGNIDMMVYLVSRGADIESIDQIGWRPISYACANNNINAVKTLIQWKSNVNKFSLMEENSPLHIAAGFGFVDIVKVLMENGANVHHHNKKRQTPMDIACENNHYGVVNVLLSASSKLIEDTAYQNRALNNFAPINSSLSRSSVFIKSNSNNNPGHIISRLKSGTLSNGDYEFKRRTIGSQSHLNTPSDIPKQKKSGSLNTVFLKDNNSCDEVNGKIEEFQSNTKTNKLTKSDIEVNLPYPSKFSTSEKLKIKSPLLSTKNFKFPDKVRRNNPSVIETFYPDQCSAQFIFPTDSQKSPIISNSQNDTKITNVRPLSSSYKREKKQSSMNCINNHQIITSFFPQYSARPLVPSNDDLKMSFHNRKSQSIRREFGSESDIKESPQIQENNKLKPSKPIKNIKNNYYVRAQSHEEYISQQKEYLHRNVTKSESNAEYTCRQWIKNLGLERIWDTLFKEGFESFLSLSLATDEELLLLCDNNIEDWDILKRNLDKLNIPPINLLKFTTNISEILFQLGLESYGCIFYDNGFFDIQQTLGFEEVNLNKLQIFKIGHRKLLLSCFAAQNNKFNINVERESPVFVSQSSVPIIPSFIIESPNTVKKDIDNSTENVSHDKLKVENTSLTRSGSNNSLSVVCRKHPPPIPFRSSSIICDQDNYNMTLDDILLPQNDKEIPIKTKKDISAVENVSKASTLDDIVDLLSNLGKELDFELTKI